MSDRGNWDWNEKPHLVPLTWKEKLGVAAFIAQLPIRSVGWAITHMREPLNASYAEHIWAHVMKAGFEDLSIEQIHMLLPVLPLRVTLAQFPSRKMAGPGLNNYNTLFPVENASARWIHEVEGRTKDDPVIFFLHGGAFFLKMMPPQVLWCGHVARKLRNERVSILALDYTVTPYRKYPEQLNEALATFDTLSQSCNRIIVTGDSAGGNLTAALVRSLKDRGSPPPWGAVLISGWYQLATNEDEAKRGTRVADYIETRNTYRASLQYATVEQVDTDPKVNMLCPAAPADYWKDVFPSHTIAVWGEKEELRGANQRFAALAGIVTQYEEPKGLHDVTVTGPGTSATYFIIQTLKRWLASPDEPPKPSSRL